MVIFRTSLMFSTSERFTGGYDAMRECAARVEPALSNGFAV